MKTCHFCGVPIQFHGETCSAKRFEILRSLTRRRVLARLGANAWRAHEYTRAEKFMRAINQEFHAFMAWRRVAMPQAGAR